jgi:hypothetical protein
VRGVARAWSVPCANRSVSGMPWNEFGWASASGAVPLPTTKGVLGGSEYMMSICSVCWMLCLGREIGSEVRF